MKTNQVTKQTKLTTYLALTAGAGFAATAANGAVVVTFYGPGARTTSTNPATRTGINFGFFDPGYSGGGSGEAVDSTAMLTSRFATNAGYFTQGADKTALFGSNIGLYRDGSSNNLIYGAVVGDQNYANISFNGVDTVYEAVAQFSFGADNVSGVGQGYLVAIAINSDPSMPLSISAGKAAIDAVPEPSSLALLALGSAGLLARRNRKLAA